MDLLNVVSFEDERNDDASQELFPPSTKTSRPSPKHGRRTSRTQSKASRSQKSVRDRNRTVVDHRYTDHLHDPVIEEEDFSSSKPRDSRKSTRTPRGGVTVAFPEKLHAMLSVATEQGFDDVISWRPHGRCFLIHQKQVFVTAIMPRFFAQTKLTSFQRQLNLYGFVRLTAGQDRGAYYHELCIRGRLDLCRRMIRTRIKGNGMKAAASPATEPNFYEMEFCGYDSAEGSASRRVNAGGHERPTDIMDEDDASMLVEDYNEAIPIVTPVLSSSERNFKPKALDWPENLIMPFSERDMAGQNNNIDASPSLVRSSKPGDMNYYKIEPSFSREAPLSLASILSPSPSLRAAMQRQEEQEVWGLSPDEESDNDGAESPHQGDEVFFEGLKFRFLDVPGSELGSDFRSAEEQRPIQGGRAGVETVYSCNNIASV